MYKSQSGMSSLVVVLVLAAFFSALSVGILNFSYLLTKKSASSQEQYQAYYIGESEILSIFRQLENDPNWPGTSPYSYRKENNGETIDALVTEVDDNLFEIEVTADTISARRKFVGTYQRGQNEIVDIVLVIDSSTSMGQRNDIDNRFSLDVAKSASVDFIRVIDETEIDAQFAIVSYSGRAVKKLDLNPTSLEAIAAIEDIEFMSGGTNIDGALQQSFASLVSGRKEANKVVLFLSDGIANASATNLCGEYACFGSGSGFAPNDGGTICSDKAIEKATKIKEKSDAQDWRIFSIFLSQVDQSDCSDPSSTLSLGRQTLLEISSTDPEISIDTIEDANYYFETSNALELNAIYTEIAKIISNPGFFDYEEVEPD